MKLTRKKAIELCIELWTWCVETGKPKEKWPGWDGYEAVLHDCWFCLYNEIQQDKYGNNDYCFYCPYYKDFGGCEEKCTPYKKWDEAATPRTRKKYAKLFLAQIKTLRSK